MNSDGNNLTAQDPGEIADLMAAEVSSTGTAVLEEESSSLMRDLTRFAVCMPLRAAKIVGVP